MGHSGLLQKVDRWEMFGNYSLVEKNRPAGFDVIAGMALQTYWAPDPFNIDLGIYLGFESKETDFSAYTKAVIWIPALFGVPVEFSVPSWLAFTSINFEMDERELYMDDIFQYRLKFAAARAYAGGTEFWSIGEQELIGPYLPASGTPLFGIPPTITAGGGYGPVFANGSCGPCVDTEYDVTIGCKGKGVGGWRFRRTPGSAYENHPVKIVFAGTPSGVLCGDCNDLLPEETDDFGATKTDAAEVSGGVLYNLKCELGFDTFVCEPCTIPIGGVTFIINQGEHRVQAYGDSITLVPNLTKNVKRWSSPWYGQLIAKGGFPRVRSISTRECGEWGVGADPIESSSTILETHPEQSVILSLVRNPTHPLEDTFAYDSLAPASRTRMVGRQTCYTAQPEEPFACPVTEIGVEPTTGCQNNYPTINCALTVTKGCVSNVQARTGPGGNSHMIPAFDHLNALARYINYTVHPHGSTCVFFPANDGSGEQARWLVFGSPIATEYFLYLRSQFVL